MLSAFSSFLLPSLRLQSGCFIRAAGRAACEKVVAYQSAGRGVKETDATTTRRPPLPTRRPNSHPSRGIFLQQISPFSA
jgi:hypothetical protein